MIPPAMLTWPFVAAGTAMATAVTLFERSRIIAEAAIYPPRRFDPELTQMVVEKVAAASEGAFAAQRAGIALAFTAARGPRPDLFAEQAVAVYEAAVQPARRKVRANARRLSAKR